MNSRGRPGTTLAVSAAVLALALAGCTGTADGSSSPSADARSAEAQSPAATWRGSGKDAVDLSFGTSVKIGGVNWFIRMEEGVVEFGEETGVMAFLQGPSQADAAQQIQITQDMLAQGVDALVVVPQEVPTMEQVLKQAMDSGVVVVTHEAPDVSNAVYDVEAFDNAAYGEGLMKNLAERMGGEGKYVIFLGSLNSTAQVEWMDAAVAYQETNYPDMELVSDYVVTDSNFEKAYSQAKQILQSTPDIKGFIGGDAGDPLGAGQAVLEAGLQDEVVVVGTSIVSYARELMQSGAVDMIATWDPADTGYVANLVALKVINGEPIEEGTDLGVRGFESIAIDGKVIYGDSWLEITVDNMDEHDF